MASNCTRLIDFEALTLEGNVRTPECEDVPGMVASLKRHGFKANHPLVVSQKGTGDAARFLVLIGNRRTMGLQWLQKNDPDEFARALSDCKGKIPAVVHRDLLPEQEVLLRIDHSADEDRVQLCEFSIFLAIKQLVKQADATQERIALALGLFIQRGKNKGKPNRPYVQPRVNLVRLPGFVQDEYRKRVLDPDSTNFRMQQVPKLYSVYNDEYVEYPNGDGPLFTALWQVCLHPETEEAEETANTVEDAKELSPTEAIRRSQSVSSSGLRNALLSVTNQSTTDLAAIDSSIVEAEAALVLLGELREYLGEEDYLALVDNARKQATEKRAVVEPVHEHEPVEAN